MSDSRAVRLLAGYGLALIVLAAALLVWPLRGTGIDGNALFPQYSEFSFGWSAYAPMPANPSPEDLRRAGVPLPRDSVAQRRAQAGVVAGIGVVLLAAAVVAARSGRRRTDQLNGILQR